MNGINEKAWEVLTDEEKLAVTLKLVNNLSTLKAGEIMGKAHYKYLEILERGKAYLKIFHEYVEAFDDVIPSYIKITPDFREYLTLLIMKRQKVKEACSNMVNPKWMQKSYRDKIITENILSLVRSQKEYNKQFCILVKDFDRWNNFRILPYEVQDPSAFKRRNKNSDIKNIVHVLNFHPYSIREIINRFEFNSKSHKATLGYCVMFKKNDGVIKRKIFTVKLKTGKTGKVLAELGKIGVYVFSNKSDLLDYIRLIHQYNFNEKDCKFGQKFWPKYRVHIRKSLNYNFIRKLIPHRKYYENSLRDMDIKLARKNKVL